jgi:hypothetical protein
MPLDMQGNRSIDVLKTAYLTANVLNIEEPAGLLKGLLVDPVTPVFPGTDNIEFGREQLGREGAPFIPMEAAAVFVGDRTRSMTSMDIPNIAMRKSIHAGDIAHDRSIGDQIFVNGSSATTQSNSLAARVDRYQRDMVRRIENTLEWWVSRILSTGTVTYSDSSYDAFTYDFGRDAAMTVTLTGAAQWDETTAEPIEDIQTIKQLVADKEYLSVNVAICSPEAAAAIRKDLPQQFNARLDNRNLDEFRQTSYIDVTAPYTQQGAVTPIGRINGIDFWEYNRSVTLFGGSAVPLVDANSIYFFHTGQGADIRQFYAPVYDMKEAPGRAINTELYSKSWSMDYPSEMQMMVQTRPLVAPFRPNFCAKLVCL